MLNHRKNYRQDQQRPPPPIAIVLSSDDEEWPQQLQLDSPTVMMDVSLESEQMKLQRPASAAASSNVPYPPTYDITCLSRPVTPSDSNIIHTKIKDYIPRTIDTHNQARLSILPMFPTSIDDDYPHLLLANVPMQLLSIEQLNQRQQQILIQPSCTFTIHDHSIPSSIRDYFEMNYQLLSTRLNVNWAILDYNYVRLDYCLKLFADERIHRLRQTPYEVRLLDKEKVIAMEFYLQMDVDLFYMKTFSDRNIQPSQSNKDLFCMITPELRFSMKPCGHQNCSVCSLSNHITRRPQSSVDFEQNGRYRFLNGYETILNAEAICNTNGIIYVLKCPCGQYEYIGESSNNLNYTLNRHRMNGNRVMHNFLIGEQKRRETTNRFRMDQNLNEINRKSGMHLYQHSARCSTVMQMFLNCYPHYWMFVPVSNRTTQQLQQQNMNYRQSESTTTSDIVTRNGREIEQCVQDVPLPPPGFHFSEHQRNAQADFFKYKEDQQLPHLPLDLYNASIIVILPEKTSPVLRQFLVSLFITHGETKLNSIGNLLPDSHTNPSYSHGSLRGDWCHSLTYPSSLSSTTTNTKVTTTARDRTKH